MKVEGRGRWKRKVVAVEEEVDVEGTSAEWVFGPGEAKEALLSLIEGGGEIRIGRKDRLGGGGGGGTEARREGRRVVAVTGHFENSN